MSTILIYHKNTYLTELKTKIISVDKNTYSIKLNESIIYPGGGGQPPDRAKINEIKVMNILKSNGDIFYQLESNTENFLKENAVVTLKIDWDFRYSVMKLHTAQHILAAVMLQLYRASIAGNSIYPTKSHVDFEIERNFTPDECIIIEKEINNIIKENLLIKEINLPFDQAKALLTPERVRLDRLPNVSTLRLIEIGTFDRTSCGGTHVNKTGEIGEIRIQRFKSQGKRRKRFYYDVQDLNPKI